MKMLCIKDFLVDLEKGQVYDVETKHEHGINIYVMCNGHLSLSDKTLPNYLVDHHKTGFYFKPTFRSNIVFFQVRGYDADRKMILTTCYPVSGEPFDDEIEEDSYDNAFRIGEYEIM